MRVDGLAKVTGAKTFGRDLYPEDLGWSGKLWYVLLLRATHADRPYLGLDKKVFPSKRPELRPAKIVTAQDLANDNVSVLWSDSQWKFGRHWLIPEGAVAEHVGQVIAILYYDSLSAHRATAEWLRSDEKARGLVRYGNRLKGNKENDIRRLVDPLLSSVEKEPEGYYGSTHYIRIAGNPEDEFSYATGGDVKGHDPTKIDANWVKDEKDKKQRCRNLEARDARDKIEHEVAESGWTVLDRTFYIQASDPVFMEPESGLAWLDADRKILHLACGTQSPINDMANIQGSESLNLRGIFSEAVPRLKELSVDIVPYPPGGAFGGRDESGFSLYLALAAVYAPEGSVRLAYDRYEQFLCGIKSHASVVSNRLAYHKDGTPQALFSTTWLDGGGELNLTLAVVGLAALQAAGMYRIPRTAISSIGVRTEGSPAGSQRGFGIPQVTFAIESMIDEVAVSLDCDPIEFRLRHAIRKGDRDVTGNVLNHNLANTEICERALREPLWIERDTERARRNRLDLAYGVGFACCMHSFGTSRDAILVEVGFDPSGQIEIWSCGVDMGQGTATSLAIATKPLLGATATNVRMGVSTRFDDLGLSVDGKTPDPDSKRTTLKFATAQSACVTAFFHLQAVEEACKVIIDHGIRPAAEAIWGTSAEHAHWDGGCLVLEGYRPLRLAQLAAHAHEQGLVVSAMVHTYFQVKFATAEFPIDNPRKRRLIDALGVRRGGDTRLQIIDRERVEYPTEEERSYKRSLYASVGHIVAVEVHRRTGQVDVVDAVTILDAGEAHHRELLAGQAEGGFAMGLSHALLEELPPAPEGTDGSWNLHRYQIIRANQIPYGHTKLVLVPLEDESVLADGAVVRKKGIAEAVMTTVPPAVHNAIAHATGLRLNSLPMTPERVRKALIENE
jgi:CO/xanthine dehydrogenase Mo-binding subunit